MNILIISHLYYPNLGGVEVAVNHLSKQFISKGHTVEIITSRWPKTLPKTEFVNGVKVTRLPFRLPSLNPISFLKFIIRAIECIWSLFLIGRKTKFDVINLHYVCENALYAMMLSNLMHIPLVTSIHGSDIQYFALKGRLNKWIVRQCLKRSAQVIANSNALLEVTSEMFGGNILENSTVIGNGVDTSKNDLSKKAFSSRPPFVLAIGRLQYIKGFDVLIKALAIVKKSFPSVKLILIGEGTERGALEKLSQRLGIKESVLFYGRMEHENVLKIIDICQFLVMPSRREAFGMVLIEAMSAGKAVIATNVGGIPELVIHEENGILVKSEDPDSMSSAILALIQDTQLTKKLGESGMKSIEKNFKWEQVSKKYLKLLSKAVLITFISRKDD